MSSAKVLKFPAGMARIFREAAKSPTFDPSGPYGLNYGSTDVPTGLADSLAHGIDFNTPGVSLFAVAFGYAHDQLAEQAQVEFAKGGHTLH